MTGNENPNHLFTTTKDLVDQRELENYLKKELAKIDFESWVEEEKESKEPEEATLLEGSLNDQKRVIEKEKNLRIEKLILKLKKEYEDPIKVFFIAFKRLNGIEPDHIIPYINKYFNENFKNTEELFVRILEETELEEQRKA